MTPLSIIDLISHIQTGDRVFISGSAGEPTEFTSALQDHPDLAAGAHFLCSFVPGVNSRNLGVDGQREMTVYFMQPGFADGLGNGSVNFCPLSYTNLGQYFDQPDAIDTVVVQVAPPDANGICSLGPQGEFLPTILRHKPRILAVLNANVPRHPNSPGIALKDITACAESNAPLRSYDAGKSNSLSQAIANHIAGLIPDGATLQCGLGKVPSQLMASLHHHRDLIFHSGMASDGLLGLLEHNVLKAGADIVSTVALGSEALYHRLPDIPELKICGVEHSHSAAVLAKLPKLRAINSALEIDLSAQVNAEMLGGRSISGPGGLPDFAAAARAQSDGLSIIALPAADPSGKHSRIVCQFSAGTPVAVPQYNVDVVVTEYGVAMLRGANQRQRAQRLIEIAHPDHREGLAKAFRDAGKAL